MNQSLDKWMTGKGVCTLPKLMSNSLNIIQSLNAVGVEVSSRSCLIMDEVDGMSAGDRGGVGALVALIKKSRVCLPPAGYSKIQC